MKSLGRIVFAFVLVITLTIAIFMFRSQNSSTPDFAIQNQTQGLPEIVVEIPAGASGSEIAKILFDNGVTKSVKAYFQVAVIDSRSEQVAPGSHRLTIKIAAKQALQQLLDPDRIPNLIKIFEGGWKSEVITSLISYGFNGTEIAQAFKKVQLPTGFGDAEGLLFPAQYTFDMGTTAEQAVQAMVDRFTKDATARKILNSVGKYTPSQLLTIASIVQAEGDTKDFAKVSRVIYNRLQIDMPLQMDSTVHFVKKVRGQIFLSTQSTLLNSPYNTYKRYGLPPGPIGSPGVAAMRAALTPATGDWLFFITVAPGDTRFTKAIAEFNSWKVLYTKNREAGAFN